MIKDMITRFKELNQRSCALVAAVKCKREEAEIFFAQSKATKLQPHKQDLSERGFEALVEGRRLVLQFKLIEIEADDLKEQINNRLAEQARDNEKLEADHRRWEFLMGMLESAPDRNDDRSAPFTKFARESYRAGEFGHPAVAQAWLDKSVPGEGRSLRQLILASRRAVNHKPKKKTVERHKTA